MSNILYTVTGKGNDLNVVAFIDGEMFQASNENPAWESILGALAANDPAAKGLFSPAKAIDESFRRVSERVSLRGTTVLFDNEPQNGALIDTIVRFLEEGNDFTPLVNFMEKLASNPNQHSREMLFDWVTATGGLSIASDGDIVAYKGVNNTPTQGRYQSSFSGNAIVDGEQFTNAKIPNYSGAIVEMPRGEVNHDPSVGCHTGLHVGTWDFASGFAGVVLEVRVNPRDVVSVPSDSSARKMRVCRYHVVDVVTEPYSTALVKDAEPEPVAEDAVPDDLGFSRDVFSPNSVIISEVSWFNNGYDKGTTCVRLKNGKAFDYLSVPRSVFEAWAASDSAGRFYNRKIKGKFDEVTCGSY